MGKFVWFKVRENRTSGKVNGCWSWAVGLWLLAIGLWLFGSWLLAVGFWLLAIGCWLLAFGYWLLAFGLALGYWPIQSWLRKEQRLLLLT